METLGDRIKSLRKSHEETQEELASVAGVTKQAISKIERVGVIDSASTTLEPIARHYGVSVRWLLEGGPNRGVQPAPESVSRSVRLDAGIVRDLAQALKEVLEESFGRTFDITRQEDASLFVDMYQRAVETGGIESRGNLIWLGSRLRGMAPQGAGDDSSTGLQGHGQEGTRRRGSKA